MSDGEGEKKKEKDETEEVKKVEMPMELGMLLPKKHGRVSDRGEGKKAKKRRRRR